MHIFSPSGKSVSDRISRRSWAAVVTPEKIPPHRRCPLAEVPGCSVFRGEQRGTLEINLGRLTEDNSPALNDIGSPLRLEYKDKRYAVMRREDGFPNCFPQERQIPAELGDEELTVSLNVADDLVCGMGAGRRSAAAAAAGGAHAPGSSREVTLNGELLTCDNPLEPGSAAPDSKAWMLFDLATTPPKKGDNQVGIRVVRAARLAAEIPLVVSDIELDVSYRYPGGS